MARNRIVTHKQMHNGLSHVHRGVETAATVNMIFEIHKKMMESDCCGICASERPRNAVSPYSCNHVFCDRCLHTWLHICSAQKRNCPSCSAPVNQIEQHQKRETARMWIIKDPINAPKETVCPLCQFPISDADMAAHKRKHDQDAEKQWNSLPTIETMPETLLEDGYEIYRDDSSFSFTEKKCQPQPPGGLSFSVSLKFSAAGDFEWRNGDTVLLPGILQQSKLWKSDTNVGKWLDLKVVYKTAEITGQRLFCSKHVCYHTLRCAYGQLYGLDPSSLTILHYGSTFAGKTLDMKGVRSGQQLVIFARFDDEED